MDQWIAHPFILEMEKNPQGSFVFLQQGIYDFGGAGGEGRYEKGTEILKKKNVNVHLKTVPL